MPREVLREMGALGFLGIRYPERHGGSQLDTIATVVLAEERGRSTVGGFAITVLVHTDMASPHLFHAGTPEQQARYLPDPIAGRRIAAVAITEADAAVSYPHPTLPKNWQGLTLVVARPIKKKN